MIFKEKESFKIIKMLCVKSLRWSKSKSYFRVFIRIFAIKTLVLHKIKQIFIDYFKILGDNEIFPVIIL